MTTDITTRALPASLLSQATHVEAARARAEVEAAVYVAQQCPRDMHRAENDMRSACSRTALAERAFYSVPNRGTGHSVHLARELARIWGNLDYGVRELRRDDIAGESEIQAYAWDQQSNVRSTRSFVVPHARMKKVKGEQTREALIDLTDIYLNNQNIGARAVREAIFSVLPAEFVAEAEKICRQTIERGDGKPLGERITEMIAAFAGIGVTVGQIETRLGRLRGHWSAADIADLRVVFTSIQSRQTTVDQEFAAPRVTAAEITGQKPAANIDVPPSVADQVAALAAETKPADGEATS